MSGLVHRNMRRRGHTGNVAIDHEAERLYLKVLPRFSSNFCLDQLELLFHYLDPKVNKFEYS